MPKNNHEPQSGAIEHSPLWTKSDVAQRAKSGVRVVNHWMKGGLPYLKLGQREWSASFPAMWKHFCSHTGLENERAT